MKNLVFTLKENFKQGLLISYMNQFTSICYIFLIISLFNSKNGNVFYGQYILLGSTISVISGFTGVSSTEGIIYFLSKKLFNTRQVLKWGFLIDLFFGIVLISILFFAKNYISEFIDEIPVQIIFLFGLKSVLKNLRNAVIGFWQFRNRFRFIYKLSLLENLTLLTSLILVSFDFFEFDLTFLVKTEFCVAASFTMLIFSFFLFQSKNLPIASTSKELFSKREFLSYNSKLFLSRTIKSGNQKFDNILIGMFLSTNEVALYDKVKKIFIPINIILNPLREIFLPKLLSLVKSNNLKLIKSNIIDRIKIILVASIFFFLTLFYLKNDIYNYLGIVNSPAIKFILYGFCFSTLYLSFFWWVRLLSVSFNPNLSIFANLISTTVIFTITPLCIKLYGFKGLGFSLFINFTVLAIYWSLKIKKYVFK